MPLDDYRRKRDFRRTPEPSGSDPAPVGAAPHLPGRPTWDRLPVGRRFCVQMHRARRLHWDLRLELDSVLLSWAMPKGPSLDPEVRHLAVHVEDHPVDYGAFEGVIPGGYGAGTVLMWDMGVVAFTRESADDAAASLHAGDLKFQLDGERLHGEFALVHIGRRGGRRGGAAAPERDDNAWLLIKKRDDGVERGMLSSDADTSVITGRSLDEIAAGRPPQGSTARSRRSRAPDYASAGEPAGASGRAAVAELLEHAPRASVADDVAPMLGTASAEPFSREGWVFEVKYDGVRALAQVAPDGVRLRGRRGRDETSRYPELAELSSLMATADALVDGELVALDERGEPSFERLQQRINLGDLRQVARARQQVPVTYMAFDLLAAEGRDLRSLPLRDRKRLLRWLLRDGDRVRYADHVEADGEGLFALLSARGIEGVIGKDAASRYETGRRSPSWVKVRAWRTQDCAVCGITAGRGGRGPVGALVLGVVDEGRLRHCGQVGSGIDERTQRELVRRTEPLRVDHCPLTAMPRTDTRVTWLRPELVCSVRHIGWTNAGTLRHPTYRGIRTDLGVEDCVPDTSPPAASVSRPALDRAPQARSEHAVDDDAFAALRELGRDGAWEIGGRRLRLTNLDKQLWPADGITKRQMIEYYVRAAPLLLPYLRDRPVGMQVFPDGIDGKHFWRKRIPDHAPDWIRTYTHRSDTTVTYVVVDEVATLAWMANGGVIDLHPWHSRLDAPELPDWAVFDLDPFPPAGITEVVELARLVHAALDHYGLRGLPKTSGQTGLQIYVPIDRGPTQEEVRAWVEGVARAIGRVAPQLVTWDWAVAGRGGRIRIDYTQNVVGKTLAAPWSLRPAPRAPVSTPIAWADLDDPALRSDRYTIADALARARDGDPFLAVLAGGQSLPEL